MLGHVRALAPEQLAPAVDRLDTEMPQMNGKPLPGNARAAAFLHSAGAAAHIHVSEAHTLYYA